MAEREVKFVLTAEDMATPVIEAFWKNIQQMQKDVNIGLNVQMQGTVNTPSTSTSKSTNIPTPSTSLIPESPAFSPDTTKPFELGDFKSLLVDASVALGDFAAVIKDAMTSIQGGKGQALPQGVSQSEVAGEFSTINVGKRFKDLQGIKPPEQKQDNSGMENMLSTQNANMLRALGQYRIAWLSSMPKEGGMMKGAAAMVIVDAIAQYAEKIIKVLSDASPLLRAELKVLRIAINEMLRPIGDLLGAVLRPISRGMLMANAQTRMSMAKDGIKQDNLKEYYSRYFSNLAGIGLGMDTSGIETLASALSIAMEALTNTFIMATGPLGIFLFKLDEISTALAPAGDFLEKWFGKLDVTTGKFEEGKLTEPFTKLGSVVNSLVAPFEKLNGVLNSIPGIGGGSGSGGGGVADSVAKTLNLGGITVNTTGARNIMDDIGDAGEGAWNAARGFFGGG